MQQYVMVCTQLLCGVFALLPGRKGASQVATGVRFTMCAFFAKRTSCSRSGLDQPQQQVGTGCLQPPRHNLLLCLHTCPALKPSPTLIQEVYFLIANATKFQALLPWQILHCSHPLYSIIIISRYTVTHEMCCGILKGP